MLDMAQVAGRARQQLFQPRLALDQGQGAQIFAIAHQQIEGEEYQPVGLAVGQGGLQRRKIRRAIMVQRHDLAVENGVGQF